VKFKVFEHILLVIMRLFLAS